MYFVMCFEKDFHLRLKIDDKANKTYFLQKRHSKHIKKRKLRNREKHVMRTYVAVVDAYPVATLHDEG